MWRVTQYWLHARRSVSNIRQPVLEKIFVKKIYKKKLLISILFYVVFFTSEETTSSRYHVRHKYGWIYQRNSNGSSENIKVYSESLIEKNKQREIKVRKKESRVLVASKVFDRRLQDARMSESCRERLLSHCTYTYVPCNQETVSSLVSRALYTASHDSTG